MTQSRRRTDRCFGRRARQAVEAEVRKTARGKARTDEFDDRSRTGAGTQSRTPWQMM